jgi:hypothetical protein
MRPINESLEKIKKAFQFVHHGKPTVPASEHWQSRVMADVRKLNELESAENSFLVFEKFFWRFSVTGQVSLIIALLYVFQVLCVNTFQTDVNYKHHIAQEFLENPDSDVFSISLGMLSDENQ